MSFLAKPPHHPWVVGWGIAAAAAVHDVHVRVHDLRSRRAECAADYTRRARPGTAKEKKRKEPITLSAELARLTPDTRQQAVGRSVATVSVTAMAVQRASYAVCEGVFVRPARPSRSV